MRDIKGYEGLYAITSCGRVWSYRRKIFLQGSINSMGRRSVCLRVDGKQETFLVHRLVAEAYLPNPEGLPQVNHKDENPVHNWLNNLEWCDAKYNMNYGTRTIRAAEKHQKKVKCLETGEVFNSIKSAGEKLSVDSSAITKCCKGKIKTAGGYHFRYAQEA